MKANCLGAKINRFPLEHQKYGYVVHAEANAILHASGTLADHKVYVTLFPCNECAKLVASKKISEVVYLSDKHRDQDSTVIAKKIFDLAGIKYRQLDIGPELLERLSQHLQKL